MEIKVFYAPKFANEESTLYRVNRLPPIDGETRGGFEAIDGEQTTLVQLYSQGWHLIQVVKSLMSDNFFLFLERP